MSELFEELTNLEIERDTANKRIAELEVENKRLSKCCSQRGARMQILFHTLIICMKRELIPVQEWNRIIGWFDVDGEPIDTTMKGE